MNAPTAKDGAEWYEHLAEHLEEAADNCRESGAIPTVIETFTGAAREARGIARAIREAIT